MTLFLNVAAVALSVTAAFASPAPFFMQTSAVFNDPLGSEQGKRRILDHLLRLTEGAVAGSSIRISIYIFDSPEFADALIAAAARGVRVQVVTAWSGSAKKAAFKKASVALTGDSWIRLCGTGPRYGACIGRDLTPRDPHAPINHNKFFLFSETRGMSNVIVQSTANLNVSSGTAMWNSAVTFTENPDLYAAYDGYFDDLAAQRKNTDYHSARRPAEAPGATLSFFPRAAGDTTLDVLRGVNCAGGTDIRVAMWAFTRIEVARRLSGLAKAGCKVSIVYGKAGNGVKAALKPRKNLTVHFFPDSAAKNAVHSKYLLVDGGYRGASHRRLVWIGSHNFTYPALRENDETLLEVEDSELHFQFVQNFAAVAEAAVPARSARSTGSTSIPLDYAESDE